MHRIRPYDAGLTHLIVAPSFDWSFPSDHATAAFAIVAGIEEAGLKLGRDVDLVSKQSSRLLHWFRREILTVDEDIKLAGRELAAAVLKRIEGADAGSLQSLSVPDKPSRGG